MRYGVVFRRAACEEALEAADYIATHGSPESARRWYQGLEAAIASLATMPAQHALAREHHARGGAALRQLVYKSHRLLFTVDGDVVHVLHVRHVARADLDAEPND